MQSLGTSSRGYPGTVRLNSNSPSSFDARGSSKAATCPILIQLSETHPCTFLTSSLRSPVGTVPGTLTMHARDRCSLRSAGLEFGRICWCSSRSRSSVLCQLHKCTIGRALPNCQFGLSLRFSWVARRELHGSFYGFFHMCAQSRLRG